MGGMKGPSPVRHFGKLLPLKVATVLLSISLSSRPGAALRTPPGGGGPRLSVTPPQRVVFSSQVGTVLACAVEGTPRPTISWTTRDGRALVAQPPYLDIMSNGSLAVHPFPPERYRADVHAATIMCRASNNFGTVVSPPIVLHAVVWQDFTVRAEGTRASVGGAALLRCLVPTHLAPHVTPTAWETPTHTVYPSPTPEGRYHMVPGSGDLLVTGVTRQDSHASFSCRVRDKLAGHTVSSQNPAKIIIEESGEASRPVVQEKRRAETVQEGDVLAVPCIASGTPTPSVRWNSYSHHGPVGGMSGGLGGLAGGAGTHGSTHTALGGVVLFVDRLQLRQPRTFTCTANNSLGVDQMSLEVTVEPRLTASVSPPMVKGDLGGSVSFTCTSSDTTAVITWYHDGVQVLGNSRVVTAVRQLIVSPVTRDDPGMYQCMVSRGGKAVQAAAQLVLGDSAPVLHYRFIEQTIQPGPSVSLKCSASGSPTPTLQWTLDGFPLTRSDRVVIGEFVGSRGDVVSHVNISRTRVEDGGLYSCMASNRAGEDNHEARLNIYGSPVARAVPAVTAVAGKEFKLRCPVAGFPLDKVIWSKNGTPIGDESLDRRVTSDGALHLPSVKRPQDAGLYTCTASNKQGHASTGTAQVTVLVPPKIAPFAVQEAVPVGERVSLTCTVSKGDTPLTITWLKDDMPLSSSPSSSSNAGSSDVLVVPISTFNSVLTVERVASHHAGTYTCVATNAAASVRKAQVLTVNVPPTWVVEPSDARAGRGQALIVDCVVRGHPEPTVVWKKKVGMGDDAYRSVQVVSPQVAQLANGSLYIARADPHHAGTYLCHASNSVTSLSKAVAISVNSPPYFSAGERTVGVRAGEQAVLKCLIRGDPPITVTWSHRGRPIHPTQRYSESVTGGAAEGDMSAELVVSGTTKHDSGPYTCTALNAHGRNTLTFQLEVHEPPSPPRGLRVMEGSSRFARISWSSPEPTPASYVVQFRKSSEPWSGAREIRTSSSVTGGVEVAPLEPSVRYVIRVVAVNHLGRSQPSEELLLTAAPERPAGAPREVHASALGPRRLRVQWKSPQQDLTHGALLGYYLGYAPASQSLRSTASIQYNFTEIEVVHGGRVVTQEGLQEAEVGGLTPHTEYQVVVQAFNSEGAGPLSLPVTVSTGEDEPGGPPRDVRCVGLSWDSVQVSWMPPENHLLNGVLRGYKLQYEQWDGWDDAARETQTTAQTTVVTGLEAATNYSVRIKAFTAPGDGPWSQPIRCTTGEDVPGRPQSVRGVVSGSGAFILAWAPPARPGGHIVSYTVTWRVLGTSRGAGRGREGVTTVAGTESWVQVEGVLGSMVEAEVVAATRVGEGPAASTRVTLTNTVPAAIYSPGGVVTTPWGRDVTLSCGHVGQPRPRLVWSHQGRPITSSAEGRLMRGDGGLVIQEARRQDSGNYTCSTTNVHGSDQVTYLLKVLVAPSAPLVLASSSTERSVQVQWKQGDTGGAPITAYTLYYRKDHGAWAQMGLHRHASKHTLKNLDCGSRYHLYMIAHNVVGSSPASSTIVVRTLGSPPRPPPVAQFLRPNSTSVTLYPHLWEARGCPITHMVFEYRQQESTQWVQVSSGDRSERRVVVTSLTPATAYALRVTAVTSAGSSSHTYSFSTLTSTGEVPPVWANAGSAPKWLSVRVLLPLVTSIVALASSLGLVCYCVKRKSVRSDSEGGNGREGGGGGGGPGGGTAVRDNKHNLAQRERYYATIRKAAPRESDRIPESADDIYPYATFQLPDPPPPNQGHIPVYQLYQARSDGTSDNYAEVSRRGSRHSRGRSRSRSRGRGVSESGEDYETQGSDTETEHGGASSRTESSNHLEETTTIREHLVSYARGGPNKDQRDAVYSRNAQREPAVPPQRIHHNLLYHAESSTSPEPSPTTERKSFPRRTKARSRVKEPESGGGGAPSVPPPSYPGVGGVPASQGPRVNFTSGVLGNRGGLGSGGGGGAGGIVGGGGSGNVVINGSPTKPGVPGKSLGITSGELPEVSEAECDRELLPPPRRYSDARHQKRPLDYSIAV